MENLNGRKKICSVLAFCAFLLICQTAIGEPIDELRDFCRQLEQNSNVTETRVLDAIVSQKKQWKEITKDAKSKGEGVRIIINTIKNIYDAKQSNIPPCLYDMLAESKDEIALKFMMDQARKGKEGGYYIRVALGATGDHRALELLKELVKNDYAEPSCQDYAIQGLARFGDTGAEAIITLFEDERVQAHGSFKNSWLFWLGQTTSERAVGFLMDVIKKAPVDSENFYSYINGLRMTVTRSSFLHNPDISVQTKIERASRVRNFLMNYQQTKGLDASGREEIDRAIRSIDGAVRDITGQKNDT